MIHGISSQETSNKQIKHKGNCNIYFEITNVLKNLHAMKCNGDTNTLRKDLQIDIKDYQILNFLQHYLNFPKLSLAPFKQVSRKLCMFEPW
jgi:hypothetical protein